MNLNRIRLDELLESLNEIRFKLEFAKWLVEIAKRAGLKKGIAA